MKMRKFHPARNAGSKLRCQRGSMLIEVLIAMVVLAIGLGGLVPLLVASMHSNNRSGTDTTSTMLAEHVLEQITAQPADSVTTLDVIDCAGTDWTLATVGATVNGGSGGGNGGNGANLTSSGYVDWTQDYGSVPSNYKMKYVSCGDGGRQNTYEVRWDVITMSSYTRMVIISARPVGAQSGMRYVIPVNLRTIGGE